MFSLPPQYYDLRALVKIADLMVVETHDLGKAKHTTYHPSRLSGLWDMMNTVSCNIANFFLAGVSLTYYVGTGHNITYSC